jgi:hypothetical protein
MSADPNDADQTDQTAAADQTATSGAAADPAEETKRKFREALEAKKGRRGEDHIDDGPQHVHGHGPVETKRTFRRKTG